ncbi:branched-chain-amino-acid aminotransferase 3, chloroplastic isoform X1 [Eutrema salsugineum]|uniref:branched-chain-amino-acid aminotransferase 3, chloroplastic isoform X1 n=1 Tax=Eutrema salsugineum TaxID=72664 RepID=UPI000CED5470|nr:branched-chain-amino-acid aminotransferase 3, chloroplastic isoform X1 [Eutrema salsugineum]
MERAAISPSLSQNYLLCPSRAFTTSLHSFSSTRNLSPSSSSIKLQHSSSSSSSSVSSKFINGGNSLTQCNAVLSNSSSRDVSELADIDWDNIGFGLKQTDYMYVMKCDLDGEFSNGGLQRFGNIEVSPSAGVLNYGQGLFEGMKAYRKEDGKNILLFRPEENAIRMRNGAERMCMPAPTVEQFVEAVKATVLANKRWVLNDILLFPGYAKETTKNYVLLMMSCFQIPPAGKGSLYIRPLLMGTGAILGLAPAPEYTFLVYVSPVGNYFKEGVAINLIVESEFHRATPGGTGGVKTIGNYAAVLKAQSIAKAKGYSDVLYLDCVYKRYLEEVSSCNIFIVKDNVISTPEIKGTILPGITRKSIMDVAISQGLQVEERNVTVDELLEADEVFCTGTAVVVSPVGSITYKDKRVSYGEGSFGPISKQLYTVLTSLQMGLSEDKMKWTVNLS